ncbi:MAG: heme-binding domain-containing protein [Sphingobacterium sp.]|nr:heme-binding domain-containing protein [Sphingobacterium sp.]
MQRLDGAIGHRHEPGDHMTSTLLKRIVLGLAVVFAGLQLVRPDRTNPPVNAAQSVQAAASVPPRGRRGPQAQPVSTATPARRGGREYSGVAPMAWGVANHVTEGRAEFNFSEWGAVSRSQSGSAVLEKMCDEVREGKMPLKQIPVAAPRRDALGGRLEVGVRLVGGRGRSAGGADASQRPPGIRTVEEADAGEVVVHHRHHQHHQHHEPGQHQALLHLHAEVAPRQALDGHDEDVPAVQHGDGQQVQQPQVQAEHGHEAEERRSSRPRPCRPTSGRSRRAPSAGSATSRGSGGRRSVWTISPANCTLRSTLSFAAPSRLG